MRDFFTRNLNALLWFFCAVFVANSCFTILFDNSYDGLSSNMSTGQFSDFSLFDWHYLGLIWIKHPLKLIQDLVPKINVFYSFYFLMVCFSSFYLLSSFNRHFLHWNRMLIFAVKLIFFIITIDSLINLTHTRFATIFSGVALFNLVVNHDISKNKQLAHILIFIFGFLVRPESGIGSMFVVLPGLWIVGQARIKILKVAMLPVACSVLFFISLETHKKFTNRFEILIEPDVEYAMSTDKFSPLKHNSSKEDSIRYLFARNAFFIDTAYAGINYFRSIISDRVTVNPKAYFNSLRHVSNFYISYSVVLGFIFLCLIFLILSKSYVELCRFSIYHICIFILLVLLDYQVHIAERHFSGLILLLLLVSFSFLKFSFPSKISNTLIWLLIPFLFLFFASWHFIQKNNLYVMSKIQSNENALIDFEKITKKRNVFVTVSGFKLFDKSYSFFIKNRNENHYFIYDLSTYSIVPRYVNYLDKTCACNSNVPLEFFKWAAKNRAIFIIDESRSQILIDYFSANYNLKIKFIDEEINSSILDKEQWPDLKFKSVIF
jgi:hypothetical protein